MPFAITAVAAKDGNSTTIAGGVDFIDTSGTGAGPWIIAKVLIDPAGVNVQAVKAASTAAGATDPSAVVALSPNSPIPVGSNVIGGVTQSGTWNVTVNTALPPGANTLGAINQAGTWNIGTVTALTALTNALPTGGNVIGAVTQSGAWSISATQSGTWNIGTVTAVTAITNALPTGANVIGAVTQSAGPWTENITTWAGSALGAPANYGTSPGAVLVPGVNSFITNVPAVSQSGTWNIGTVTAVTAVTAITNALPTGANTIGAVTQASGPWTQIGFGVTVSTGVTRPADTIAYAANDCWSDSTTTPTAGGFTFTSAGRISGGSGVITDIVVISSGDPATTLQGELWIYDAAVTAVNDNAAFASSDADTLLLVAVVPFTMSSTAGGSGTTSFAHLQGLNIGFTAAGTANLRFLIKVKNAYTPISAEVLTFRLKILQTN